MGISESCEVAQTVRKATSLFLPRRQGRRKSADQPADRGCHWLSVRFGESHSVHGKDKHMAICDVCETEMSGSKSCTSSPLELFGGRFDRSPTAARVATDAPQRGAGPAATVAYLRAARTISVATSRSALGVISNCSRVRAISTTPTTRKTPTGCPRNCSWYFGGARSRFDREGRQKIPRRQPPRIFSRTDDDGRSTKVGRDPDTRSAAARLRELHAGRARRRAGRRGPGDLGAAADAGDVRARRSTHPPQELYRAYLAQSDIFIGLYWQRYGWVGPGMDISGLEDEFRLSGSLPRLLYIKAPAPDREPRLTAMIDELAGRGDRRLPHVPHARASSAGWSATTWPCC